MFTLWIVGHLNYILYTIYIMVQRITKYIKVFPIYKYSVRTTKALANKAALTFRTTLEFSETNTK